MKCFNHHDRDAFVVCKSCGKALCLECAEEYKNSYICKGSKTCKHVAAVNFVNYFKSNSTCSYVLTKLLFLLVGIFLAIYVFTTETPLSWLDYTLFGILIILLIKKGLEFRLK